MHYFKKCMHACESWLVDSTHAEPVGKNWVHNGSKHVYINIGVYFDNLN